jgi:hypothetical protein
MAKFSTVYILQASTADQLALVASQTAAKFPFSLLHQKQKLKVFVPASGVIRKI